MTVPFLIENPTDLYYLTGLQLSAGSYVETPQGPKLVVDGRYTSYVKEGSIPVVASLKEALYGFQKVRFDSSHTSYQRFEKLKSDFPTIEWVAEEGILHQKRALKDAEEIQKITASALLNRQGIAYVESLLKPGIFERELATALEIFWLERGASGLAFETIIAFGSNSAFPHHRASSRPLKEGEIVQLDCGVCLNHYMADMSRVFFFGEVNPELHTIRHIVEKAQRAALSLYKPGATMSALYRAAKQVIDQSGYGDKFPHSLGHGIGLETHEWPLLRDRADTESAICEPGMVLTFEPGIYLPGLGGVRLEEMALLTEKGYKIL